MPETTSTLTALVGRLASLTGASGALSAGDRSVLRRMDPNEPPAAFFKLLALCPDLVLPQTSDRLLDQETRWASVVQGLAILGPLHDPQRPFGRALAQAQESELRLARLLRGDAAYLIDELPAVARRLLSRGARVDWTGAAALILSADRGDDERVRRRLAREFYSASGDATPAH